MMQSYLAARQVVSAMIHKRSVPLWVRSSSSIGRTADPGIRAGEPEGLDVEAAERGALAQQKERERELDQGVGEKQPPHKPPTTFASSPTIGSSDVNVSDPVKQQRRHYNAAERQAILGDVSCVGVDGYSDSRDDDRRREAESGQRDDQQYFKNHKASPLSEVELADTRKPISQATDGTATNAVVGAVGEPITWKEEQLESAEETLMRTMRMWRETVAKGDPDAPQSRALRAALRARGDPVMDF